MFGDPLPTDILGARRFGIDSALVMTGLTREYDACGDIVPDYELPSLLP